MKRRAFFALFVLCACAVACGCSQSTEAPPAPTVSAAPPSSAAQTPQQTPQALRLHKKGD